MSRGALFWILLLLSWATACRPAAPAGFTHDAYIWQRQWTPAVERAVQASSSRVAGWRVLGAEIEARGRLIESAPRLDVLARTGKPVTVVVRISGQVADWDREDVVRRGVALVRRWRDAGVDVIDLEIDHDCGTAGLRQYALFLEQLRRNRPPGVTLSITALPAWLESDRVEEVLRSVDLAVLQTHAVQDPRFGLFDADRARAWAWAWSKISAVPFRIALPTYGSRVTWTPAGRIIAIESEAHTFGDPANSRELFATPRDIVGFIETVRRDPPPHLQGISWFRLPTDEDDRAWSLDTWHAAIDRRPLTSDIRVDVEPDETIPGLYDVFLRNRGDVEDAVPPAVMVTAAGGCEAADAMAPYTMEQERQAISFRRQTPRLLARHQQTLIGWVRCRRGEVQAHAQS